jgi:hypothetical protein
VGGKRGTSREERAAEKIMCIIPLQNIVHGMGLDDASLFLGTNISLTLGGSLGPCCAIIASTANNPPDGLGR